LIGVEASKLHATLWCFGVQFETVPFDFNSELFFQPDQTGPLGDIAERSDEV
jgi:hypothetical protein